MESDFPLDYEQDLVVGWMLPSTEGRVKNSSGQGWGLGSDLLGQKTSRGEVMKSETISALLAPALGRSLLSLSHHAVKTPKLAPRESPQGAVHMEGS